MLWTFGGGGGRRCIGINGDHIRSVVGASGLELGPLGQRRPRGGKSLGMVECNFGMEWSSERRMTSERLDVAETPDWALGVMNFLGETLGSLNKYHHTDEGQILIATDASCFSTCWSLQKGSRGCRDTRMDCARLKIHHDTCAVNLSDRYGFSGINYRLHSWLTVVTSSGWIS